MSRKVGCSVIILGMRPKNSVGWTWLTSLFSLSFSCLPSSDSSSRPGHLRLRNLVIERGPGLNQVPPASACSPQCCQAAFVRKQRYPAVRRQPQPEGVFPVLGEGPRGGGGGWSERFNLLLCRWLGERIQATPYHG